MVKGETMSTDLPYSEPEDFVIHYLREIAIELKKIRKEINYANTKEKQ
jgi:hypothetical protein